MGLHKETRGFKGTKMWQEVKMETTEVFERHDESVAADEIRASAKQLRRNKTVPEYQIWPLMSTRPKAAAFADSKNPRPLPVRK